MIMHNDHRNEEKFPPVRGAPNSFKTRASPAFKIITCQKLTVRLRMFFLSQTTRWTG